MRPLTVPAAIQYLDERARQYHIADVAEAAGVSLGTVRRSLTLAPDGQAQCQVRTLVALAEAMELDFKVVLE
jgi:DNA-binding phage protein